ncbi:hypothetical protein ACFVP3_38815 [Streptomyces sp. NPDC057806]|uniref:hypothetical protein n=1 Tax=Streptomyces sp. NPDC057806 TaxID=3346255 RepID=UPI0036B43912
MNATATTSGQQTRHRYYSLNVTEITMGRIRGGIHSDAGSRWLEVCGTITVTTSPNGPTRTVFHHTTDNPVKVREGEYDINTEPGTDVPLDDPTAVYLDTAAGHKSWTIDINLEESDGSRLLKAQKVITPGPTSAPVTGNAAEYIPGSSPAVHRAYVEWKWGEAEAGNIFDEVAGLVKLNPGQRAALEADYEVIRRSRGVAEAQKELAKRMGVGALKGGMRGVGQVFSGRFGRPTPPKSFDDQLFDSLMEEGSSKLTNDQWCIVRQKYNYRKNRDGDQAALAELPNYILHPYR